MPAAVREGALIIPPSAGGTVPPPAPDERERLVNERLGRLWRAVARNAPVEEIIRQVLADLSELFGISEMLFEARAEEAMFPIHWAVYGLPEERARAAIENLSGEYHPKDLIEKIVARGKKVSSCGYYIPAEEWFKLASEDPFIDHPSYYRHPERAREPRQSPDEWHEADSYRFVLKDESGDLLGWIELEYSVTGKLLTQDEVESIDSFVQLVAHALAAEKRRQVSAKPALVAAQERTELLEDVLTIASSIVSERDLKKLSEMILASLASLFGFGKVTLVVHDESEGVFKWVALYGYPDTLANSAKSRSIPTDVVLEDLRATKRIGKTAYLGSYEEASPRSREYFLSPLTPAGRERRSPRRKDEFRPGDYLAFALHDAAGRVSGVIYATEPKDMKMPDSKTLETIQIFTSLAEVAIENARLAHEREEALRVSSQRAEQLSRILDLATGIMYVRDLDQMLDSLLKTLARLLGIRRMVIGVKHEDEGVYRVEAVYGYSQKAAEAIKRITYPIQEVDGIIDSGAQRGPGRKARWWTKLGRMTYYMPAESQEVLSPEELAYYPEPELLRKPRAGKGHWHELDWMDTIIVDRKGVPIAYLEVLKPRDDRVPDAETVELVEIFASLAGIAIENARMFQEQVNSRREAELYADVLSHDIKNFNQAILGYLDLLRAKLQKPENMALLDKIAEQVMNTSWLASNIRTMSRLTFGEVELTRTDLGAVLLDSAKSVSQYYPGRSVVVNHQISPGVHFVRADELMKELFVNILTNAVKYDSHEQVVIDIAVEKVYADDGIFWLVSIADRGRGIPDDVKPIVFDRFSKAPRKKGSGMGLHIVKTLARRYGGKVWVEDRVKGDYRQGSVFKVQLPVLE